MDRLLPTLLLLLIVTGLGNAFITWDADRHAREDAERERCLQKAEATAAIVLVGGGSDGRVEAAQTLGRHVDAC